MPEPLPLAAQPEMQTTNNSVGLLVEIKKMTWGKITLVLLVIQVGCGIMLALNYQPGFPSGYDSTLKINQYIPMGWLVRGVHRYCAYALALAVFIHMASLFFRRSFRNYWLRGWLLGLCLFALVLLSIFSGTVLPMDMTGSLATRVALSLAAAFPLIGDAAARLLFGFDGYGAYSPYRFYLLHISVLPMLMLVLLAWHPLKGLGRLFKGKIDSQISMLAATMLAATIALVAVAAVFPPELGEKFDALKEVRTAVHPIFIFMGIYYLVGLVSAPWQVLALLSSLFVIWALTPWLDIKVKSPLGQRIFDWIGLLLLSALVWLTILAYPLTAMN